MPQADKGLKEALNMGHSLLGVKES